MCINISLLLSMSKNATMILKKLIYNLTKAIIMRHELSFIS